MLTLVKHAFEDRIGQSRGIFCSLANCLPYIQEAKSRGQGGLRLVHGCAIFTHVELYIFLFVET